MDHHRPLGRLPLRVARAGLLGALAASLLIGCGDDAVLDVTTAAPTTTALTTTTTTTTSTSTTTTSTTTSTTTTTIAPETWQADDRTYYFPIQRPPPEAANYSNGHHDYPATDIFAPTGSTVVAVTDGVIDELRRDDPYDPAEDDPAERGGRFVSIVGDDGVRYYCSHLDSVIEGLDTGDRVAAGQVIGEVGNSGNAATTSPHCHFGISHPTSAGDWKVRRGEVWPYEYLKAWERGEDLVPVLPIP